ncbi:hypothetical protein ACFQ5N_05760 [Lutibacter holmesii]|uniref:DUF1593 domain-containing protein n=1 Tax=Lutibacter holmesii TaxID=1137985 RepID=A0ABW3WLY9_9FLAO
MRFKIGALIVMTLIFMSFSNKIDDKSYYQRKKFDVKKDLLLVQLDCKTDVDDLHTAAALATQMYSSTFSSVNYHVVTGTYGDQKGLYVPPNNLLKLAFKNNWTDAHENEEKALEQVMMIVKKILDNQGDVWVAEAGQSNFTAKLIKTIQAQIPEINTVQHIHVVQHSGWNEDMTTPQELQYVKSNADYQKIPDGNAVGNGTPGFRDSEFVNWKEKIKDSKLLEIWELAIDLSNQYNGKDERYMNAAVSSGGLDFSDLSEVCWILSQEDIKNVEQFFNLYAY